MIYHLSTGVRARKESFGLLFYNSGDARLTFVRSGALLRVEPRATGHVVKVSDEGGAVAAKASRILATLVKKGLIVDERSDL